MNPLHIGFLCNEYPPGKHGGVGAFTQTLARAMIQRGHRVSVFGLYPNRKEAVENDRGVDIYRLPQSRLPQVAFVGNAITLNSALRRASAARPFDVLEGPELSFAFISTRVAACRVIRLHGGHHFFYRTAGLRPKPGRSWIERRSFAKAYALAAVSRFVAKQTREFLQLGDIPIELLPNPVDTDRFRPLPEIPVVNGRITLVGTLCEKKGIRQLVQAMPSVIKAVPNAHLIVCGRDTPSAPSGGSFRTYLQSLIPSALTVHFEFKDHVANEELPGELATAAVLAYPSHMEAHPVAWLEGMSMGKAIVASNTGPGPEIIEDGVSGLLCNPHDSASIAASIIRVLKDRELANRLGTAARSRAAADFSLDRIVPKNELFYRSCAERFANSKSRA